MPSSYKPQRADPTLALVPTTKHSPLNDYLAAKMPIGRLVEDLAVRYNLTGSMQRFLLHRLDFASDSATARFLGLAPHTVAEWKGAWRINDKTKQFKAAYNELFRRQMEAAQVTMEQLAVKAVIRTEEMLDAVKKTRTRAGVVEDPDYKARADAIAIISRWVGLWGEGSKSDEGGKYAEVLARFVDYLQKPTVEVIEAQVVSIET